MRYSRVLVLGAIAFAFIACDSNKEKEEELGGRDVTVQFINEYNGDYIEQTSRSDSGERFSISRDGQIEILKIRQVGKKNNPAIPSGTICSYYLSGQIRHVVELFDETRQRINDSGSTYMIPETHHLIFSVHEVTLTDELESETTSSEYCQNFQEQMNQQLPVYTYGMELFGSGTFRLHTGGGEDYEGGEPSELLLDEVFTRI